MSTVAQLIAKLQTMDQNALVVTNQNYTGETTDELMCITLNEVTPDEGLLESTGKYISNGDDRAEDLLTDGFPYYRVNVVVIVSGTPDAEVLDEYLKPLTSTIES